MSWEIKIHVTCFPSLFASLRWSETEPAVSLGSAGRCYFISVLNKKLVTGGLPAIIWKLQGA